MADRFAEQFSASGHKVIYEVACLGVREIVSVENRLEQAGDEMAIYKVTADAFRGRLYADGDEQDLVNRLRELGQLTLSLVCRLLPSTQRKVAL